METNSVFVSLSSIKWGFNSRNKNQDWNWFIFNDEIMLCNVFLVSFILDGIELSLELWDSFVISGGKDFDELSISGASKFSRFDFSISGFSQVSSFVWLLSLEISAASETKLENDCFYENNTKSNLLPNLTCLWNYCFVNFKW